MKPSSFIESALKVLNKAKTPKEFSRAVDYLLGTAPSKDDRQQFKTCDFSLDNEHMKGNQEMTHIAGREDVFALIDGQPERWRVGDIAELKRPDTEWIKKNSGIDIGKVRHVAWNTAIDAWVIHLHK